VFAALDPQRFQECFVRWTQSLRTAISGEIVAIDGKALRRAMNKGQSTKYIVNAWARQNGLVLGQFKVADKSNEITAVPELPRALELSGCIVTADVMGCQKKIARGIVEADADYVLVLKDNQETVHEEVKAYLDDAILRQALPLPPVKGPGASPNWTAAKSWGRIMAGSKPAATGRANTCTGSPTGPNGKNSPVWT
jgi:hypothetical protein